MLDLSRRGLIAGIGALIAAPAIVKASSLMPVTGGIVTRPALVRWPYAGKSLLTINQITREAIKLFCNSNQFIQNIDRQYDAKFAPAIGTTLRIRMPTGFRVVDATPLEGTLKIGDRITFADWERGLSL